MSAQIIDITEAELTRILGHKPTEYVLATVKKLDGDDVFEEGQSTAFLFSMTPAEREDFVAIMNARLAHLPPVVLTDAGLADDVERDFGE
jgi:hypothetical protein